MGFEFLSDMAIGTNDNTIDDVVHGRKNYAHLKNAPLKTKVQVLATGLGVNKDFEGLLKNGRPPKKFNGITEIGGYPAVVRKLSKCGLPAEWESFFLPNSDDLNKLPLQSLLLKFDLRLQTPFYSKDDMAHYVIENPLRREWVFQAPYLSAAGVKGLFRWAWRMRWGDEKKNSEERDLFGPRQGDMDDDNAMQGCLYTYPLFWKGDIGLEVINPHDRVTGTGKNPIKYEVVSIGGRASLFLMFVNRTEELEKLARYFDLLREPITILLEHSGLSAKRSAGWGDVAVEDCEAWFSLSRDEKGHLHWKVMPEFLDAIGKTLSNLNQ